MVGRHFRSIRVAVTDWVLAHYFVAVIYIQRFAQTAHVCSIYGRGEGTGKVRG